MTIYTECQIDTSLDPAEIDTAMNELSVVIIPHWQADHFSKKIKAVTVGGTDSFTCLLIDLPAGAVYLVKREWYSMEECVACTNGINAIRENSPTVAKYTTQVIVRNDDNY